MQGLFGEAADAGEAARPGPAVESVSALTGRIADGLRGFGRVHVEGELSGLKRAASGHVYFDLKDASARISCVVWRSNVARVGRFNPSEGDQLIAHGKLDVYAPRGGYSLIVDHLEPVGVGALLAKLEALKAELAERGWFERRRPLPAMPRTIGVVTSRDGAALRDFLRTRTLRWPLYPVRLVHTAVQGPGAAEGIAQGVRALAESGVDVIVVTRGGGSLEDLWAFNEEPVARAIWDSPVPVVSGVGHETDTTLADLVADHRAHTPTDAAQTLIPDRAALEERLERVENHMLEAVHDAVEERRERLERLRTSRVLRDADWILSDRARELEHLLARLGNVARRAVADAEGALTRAGAGLAGVSPRAQVEQWERRLIPIPARLRAAVEARVERAARGVEVSAGKLEAFSPLKVLARGYSVTTDASGRALRNATEVEPGATIETRLGNGVVRSTVNETLDDDGDARR